MALIGKIRKNMWLVIVLLAVALAGFILMDMTSASNRGGGLFNSRDAIGKVDGTKINYNEFQIAEQALYSGSGDVYGRRNSLWNYFVERTIVEDYADKLGLGVAPDELSDLEFGANLSPIVQNNFRNPQTGQVDRQQLSSFQQAINEGKELNPQFTSFWNEQRKQIIKTQKQTKFNNLVAKAMYVPNWQAELMAKFQTDRADIDYVLIPFESVADSEVQLTDEDFEAYIKKNKVKYTNTEEVRNINYVVYDVLPTAQDSQKIYADLVAFREEFINTKDDSTFVVNNQGFFPNAYAKKDDLQGILKDTINKFSVGDVVGPFESDGMYIMAKLIDKKIMPDSAQASHILRNVTEGDALGLINAKAYIDSLKTIITSGTQKFSDVAITNSNDPGSAEKGGDLGTFAPGTMVQPFNDAIFVSGKEGGLYTVETQFGVHLIQVKKLIYTTNEPRYKLGYLTAPIVPSQETQDKVLDDVLAVVENNKTIESLTASVKDLKIETASSVKKNDFNFATLGGSQTSRDMIRWAFDPKTKAGSVSPTVYTYTDEVNFHDSKHVVVGLKDISKAGLGTVAALKSSIEALVKNEKKAEIIKSKITSRDLNSLSTTFNVEIVNAEGISFASAVIPQVGNEPKIVGKLFSLSTGEISEPLVGSTGVMVLKVNTMTPGEAGENFVAMKSQAAMMSRSQVSTKLIESLKKSSKVSDNRYTFY